MLEILSLEKMKTFGVAVLGRIMPNGERRFSLKIGAVGYIWTEAPADRNTSWQEAHHHRGLHEHYIVQRGRVALAYLYQYPGHQSKHRLVQVYNRLQIFTVRPGEDHNVYLFPGSTLHTVQYGDAVANVAKEKRTDWFDADANFAAWTKGLSEADMLKLDAESMHRHQ